jgi:AcrR family transcriptional regulator
VRLFVKQGYDATTVDQIAREAGSSRATVFRYFGSKEDILFARYRREFEELCAGLRGRKGSDSRRARGVLLELADRLQADRDAFRLELRLIIGNPRLQARALVTMHAWAGILAHELSRDRSDDAAELPARIAAHSGVAALQEAICIWHTAGPEASLAELATEALRLALPAGRRS